MTIRVACVGGGPGGLFFSALLKQYLPDAQVDLFERNQATDVFGFGVVFSDSTLRRIDEADPVLRNGLAEFGEHWDQIAVTLKGETVTFAGNGMAAIHRKTLLGLLQARAAEVGVSTHFGHSIRSLDEFTDYDIVVGADGANSFVRESLDTDLGVEVDVATAKFIWFGTTYLFDGLTFLHRRSEFGNFAVHAYPISDELSTFIVETDAATWKAAGLDEFDVTSPPGVSDQKSMDFLQKLFAEDIDGEKLVANNSRWANFRTRRTGRWHSGTVVLLGDAVHTAHFSVGSGTKMAMEDAVVLARSIADHPDDPAVAFAEYEEIRQPQVAKIQNSARPSLSWWEHFGEYYDSFDPLEFTFHFFSRSIDLERIRQRDPGLASAIEQHWLARHGDVPLRTPLSLANGVSLASRKLSFTDHDGATMLSDEHGTEIPVVTGEGIDGPVPAGSAVVMTAPASEEELAALETPVRSGASIVLVDGPNPVTRVLLSERLRLQQGIPTVLFDDEAGDVVATTLLLAGRADAVASRSNEREPLRVVA
ncbi:FAD-dependent monooxygenase [Subtercola frigoramans]|uniref:Anthraniloyl-CoA monooxygenase n=1 Tax=Subtercola frigoramans TaxID=120298 RepID=A0ABS2L9C3_9MICO|nr:FAD-dependent monooxygenase [Subtercola frigoramans]MBM7473696.1 anthraniloyl-CoA monooxygenase [Subtercola frigoramans]